MWNIYTRKVVFWYCKLQAAKMNNSSYFQSWNQSETFPVILYLGERRIPVWNSGSVGWGCKIYWLHLCRRGKTPSPPNRCPGYDMKQSDGEAPVMLELWGVWSTTSLLLDRSGSTWCGPIYGSKNCVQTNEWSVIELLVLNSNT